MNSRPQKKDDLVQRVKAMPLKPVIEQYIRLARAGKDKFKGLCPFHAERTPSFLVNEDKGTYYCFGCRANGSIIDFLMQKENLDFRAALHEAALFYGLKVGVSQAPRQRIAPVEHVAPEEEQARKRREIETAQKIFSAALPADGTLVEGYLREVRQIPLEKLSGGVIPPTIRYAPAADYWHAVNGKRTLIGRFPAMVTAIQGFDRAVIGAHITYLDPVTADKIKRRDPNKPDSLLAKKKIRGAAVGGALRLAAAGEHMQVAEGIENALTAMAFNGVPAWAAISLYNLAGRGLGEGEPHPRLLGQKTPSVYPDLTAPSFRFPEIAKKATVIKDSDSKDWESAEKLFERAGRKFLQQGIEELFFVSPPRGHDLNSMLRAAW